MKHPPLERARAEARRERPDRDLARATVLATLVLGGLSLASCGNYSNEDLEFLNALPQTDDVSMEAPLRSAVRLVDEDDALRTTIRVTTLENAAAAGALGFIDEIRATYPSARQPNVRIWGPFPDDRNPGWKVKFEMTRSLASDGVTPHFAYRLVMIAPAGTTFGTAADPTSETEVLAGWFERVGPVAGAQGHLVLSPKEARDAGAFLKDLEKLVTFTVDYDNRSWPRSLVVTIVNEPPADPTTEAASATYTYERSQNGDGAMTFTFLEDAVPGPLGVDTLDITSRWHGTGEGRARVSVLAGDGAGVSWVDCWAATSLTSYNSRTGEGDPSTCISEL